MLKLLKNSSLALLATTTFAFANADDVDKANDKVQTTKQHMEIAKDMDQNVTIQNSLEASINSLATQMMQNTKLHTSKSVLITSFVRLDNFKKTSEFGRLVGESLINELSMRGFNVIEFRGQMAVSVNEHGEYFITRNTSKMNEQVINSYVVVGTYSRQYGKIVLNARVMDNATGSIISSARSVYQHGLRDDCVIFKDCQPPRTIKIIPEQ